jgi:hypothetical protein
MIKAMKQALEALEEYQAKGAPFMSCDAAVAALRAAIAEVEKQEPVAFIAPNGDLRKTTEAKDHWEWGAEFTPLYTTPPAQPARVQPADDLSDVLKRADVLYQKIGQQWFDLIPRIYSQARADKLKEKNT